MRYLWKKQQLLKEITQLIDKSNKKTRIVDGNNWFWLCTNHNKMFEFWIIYFDWDEMKIKEPITRLSKTFFDKVISLCFILKIGAHSLFSIFSSLSIAEYINLISNVTLAISKYLEIHKSRVFH